MDMKKILFTCICLIEAFAFHTPLILRITAYHWGKRL